jgi:repressor LexA
MSRRQLTSKQHHFLDFITRQIKRSGVWPTYREIIEEFGYRSPNSVTQNLQALAKKGFLKQDSDGYHLTEQTGFGPSMGGIPIRGIITAGVLQEAVEADLGTITLETLFPNLDRIFAIRVSGQSMTGVGIEDGDYVLLVDDDVKNGSIGAVMYHGETTLKRIYYDRDGLRLEPANPEFEDVYIQPDVFEEVRVLGRYIGHVNKSGIYRKSA